MKRRDPQPPLPRRVTLPQPPAAPTVSWWLDVKDEDFSAKAAQQLPRLSGSKMASAVENSHGQADVRGLQLGREHRGKPGGE
jgi:hypothetical protein